MALKELAVLFINKSLNQGKGREFCRMAVVDSCSRYTRVKLVFKEDIFEKLQTVGDCTISKADKRIVLYLCMAVENRRL